NADTHTFTWDFNDGSSPVVTHVPSVAHTFKAGTYNVQVTVEDDDTGTDTFTRSGVTVSPLLVSPTAPRKTGQGNLALTATQAANLMPQAIALWAATGLPVGDYPLASLSIVVDDLSSSETGVLAWYSNGTMTIDDDAAGYGWFIDTTPANATEFPLRLSDQLWRAHYESPAYGNVDLLTVLTHELGHVFELVDLPTDHGILSLMGDTLGTGERRYPAEHDWRPGAVAEPLPIGPLNGTFGQSDPHHPDFGWHTIGNAAVDEGRGVLTEQGSFNAEFAQSFIVPADAMELRFTVISATLGKTALNPGDAFEVALLDAETMAPLSSIVDQLDRSDALINLQYDGTVFYSDLVSSLGLPESGQSIDPTSSRTFSIDLSNVPSGDKVTLYFDLLGFGDEDAQVIIDDIELIREGAAAGVIAHHIFYNNSWYDGRNPNANESDDQAIAPDKTPLLPGNVATFANYTSYYHGINGIMIDVADLADPSGLSVEDFTFRVGNDGDPTAWADAPTPSQIVVRSGAGENGSDRITVVWPDKAVEKTWLQVTLKANTTTGLSSDAVAYWGNAIGDVGNSSTTTFVDGTDLASVTDNQRNFLDRATIENVYDFNRDRLVDGTDWAVVRDNYTNFLTDLNLIAVPDLVNGIQPVQLPEHTPRDVNRDGMVTPLDALLIINQLDWYAAHHDLDHALELGYRGHLDVNADGFVSPLDVLRVIYDLDRIQDSPHFPASHVESLDAAFAELDQTTPPKIKTTSVADEGFDST
ncbi:MAG: PKD domain-containing protein, partial [Planctomycetales bacterium]|nr:PKD domain-containing protein [Planctomycetales bacterium]